VTLDAKKLVAQVLEGGGTLSLVALLADAVPIERLRGLARAHGLAPKGFRVEKAPAKALAEVLVDVRAPDLLEDAVELLIEVLQSGSGPAEPKAPGAGADLRPMLELRARELAEARDRLASAYEQAARQRAKEDDLHRALESERSAAIRVRVELEAARLRAQAPSVGNVGESMHEPRLRELERSLEEAAVVEAALRLRMAEQQTKLNGLAQEVQELEALLPKGKRRKAPPPELKLQKERLRVPYFTGAFYRSLADKERRAIEQAFWAIFTLCSEGPAYPGLEVKQLEGVGLWSLRASLKLRVYFRFRSDGDVEIEQLADREDQNTTLRRLKDR
jgi:hypothetical protein